MRVLCKDRHFRLFWVDWTKSIPYYCSHCYAEIAGLLDENKTELMKSHICKERLKELKIISQPESPAS